MKYILITGSSTGIGLSIGKEFLNDNYYVIFNYSSNEENIYKLKKDLVGFKDRYSIIKLDLSVFENIELLYKEVTKITEKIDVLILNAAITDKSNFKDITIENWNKVMNVNLNIPFFITQKFSSIIKDNGRIIFIGALLGIVPDAISTAYAVSKAGLHMLAKSLVKVFKDRKITVNTIAPGFVSTNWQDTKPKEQRERIENRIALSRFGTTEEVARICKNVVDNDYINGAVIQIDGGYQ